MNRMPHCLTTVRLPPPTVEATAMPAGVTYNLLDMMIHPELAKAFNEQIGHEFGASMQYVSIAAHFQSNQLTLLAKLFFEQAEEERQHALKHAQAVLPTKGEANS